MQLCAAHHPVITSGTDLNVVAIVLVLVPASRLACSPALDPAPASGPRPSNWDPISFSWALGPGISTMQPDGPNCFTDEEKQTQKNEGTNS